MSSRREKWIAFLMVSPSLVAILVFVYGFIGWSGWVSLSQWKGQLPDYTWAGLSNYLQLFSDPRFHVDLRNTLIFAVVFIGGCLLLGFGLAVLLEHTLRGEAIFRTIFLFPMAISFIVTGVVWRWLLNPAVGERMSGLNLLLHNLGLGFLENSWHTTPVWGIAAVALAAVWQMSGFIMAMFLAGLRSIPEELREAARVDGATTTETYRYIILPLLAPVSLSALVMLGHVSLKVFDLIVAVAGKQVQLDVPALYLWQTTFDGGFYGRGAAIGILLLISVALLVVPYMTYTLRHEAEL